MESNQSNRLNQEKINEGKFLANMGLEKKVLADGVMPNSPIMDRCSLVKGIIDGYFESGQWQKAVKAVYTAGSPVRTLFNGNWDEFRKKVLASAQENNPRYFGQEISLLLEHREFELVYNLATRLPIQGDRIVTEISGILDSLGDNISGEQRRKGYGLLAERAWQKNDWPQVFEFYEKGNDQEGMDKLYQEVISQERIIPGDGGIPLDFLLKLATFREDKEKERVEAVAQFYFDGRTRTNWVSRRSTRDLYDLLKIHQIELASEQRQKIMDNIVRSLSDYELKEVRDEQLVLLWAKKNVAKEPKNAYHILTSSEYDGPEVLTAALNALKIVFEGTPEARRYSQKLEAKDIKKEHREQLLHSEGTPMEIKVKLAIEDQQHAFLREFSGKYKKEGDLEKAYQLWIDGKGDPESSYVQGLRKKIIQGKLEEASSYGPPLYFLSHDDKPGHHQAYQMVVERFPETAYHLARRILDEELTDKARRLIVKASPEEAFRKFSTGPKDNDSIGIDLALDALAEKYQVPKEKVRGYLGIKEGIKE